MAERAVGAVAPRVDLALAAQRQAVPHASGDAHDAPLLHRRHQRWRADTAGLVRFGIGVHGVPQEEELVRLFSTTSEQAAFRVHKEAETFTPRERRLPPKRVAQGAFQEERHPR